MTDDAAYVNAIIDDVSSKYNVDTKRIFLVGHSAGAFLAQGLACGVSDRIAAIASLAGALIAGGPCNPSSRLSVLDVHGDADTIISYEGGSFFGAPAQTLTYTSADGDPNRGALVLTVAFTDIGQFALAGVDFAQPGLNLSGRTLHARVRLVSGSFDGVLLLGALSGPSFIVAESPAFDAAPLATGAWASLTFDLSTSTVVGFDPSKVVAIGVRALASAPLVRTGETIFEIDTVSD
jgi:pimeloyl-ACP methyl ester carboxylesterase